MKKRIATLLRRAAQWLDPQKEEVTGYARKVLEHIPYNGIDIYRRQMMEGREQEAHNLKASMRVLAEIMASKRLEDRLIGGGIVRFEHNFGTEAKVIDGMVCEPDGLTVIVELKGTWS